MARRGLHGAVEMCNNNGACRKLAGGVMCPSFRATRNERDATRGRANTLRLAITGQLGPTLHLRRDDGDDEAVRVLQGCRRECPTGVDMAKMKIEVLAARRREIRPDAARPLVGDLPRYAPWRPKRVAGECARCACRACVAERKAHRPRTAAQAAALALDRVPRCLMRRPDPEVLFFADTFNRYFEPENLRAAPRRGAGAAGLRVAVAEAGRGRPLCCGRTLLRRHGREARAEMQHTRDAPAPVGRGGRPVVGLEPSCDSHLPRRVPARFVEGWTEALGKRVMHLRGISRQAFRGWSAAFGPLWISRYLHGHCHQKALTDAGPVQQVLSAHPGPDVARSKAHAAAWPAPSAIRPRPMTCRSRWAN